MLFIIKLLAYSVNYVPPTITLLPPPFKPAQDDTLLPLPHTKHPPTDY